MNASKSTPAIASLRVDAERLWRRHMEMAKIGALPGEGSCRLAMSSEDAEARALLARWCRDAGLGMEVDRAGNMFFLRPGADATLPPVAAGSHLDTQPHGGRFDGVSGVLAALEAVETMNDFGVSTIAPIAVINWTNEEGVRYGPGLMGSSWYAGHLDDAALDDSRAPDGTRFAEEAEARGWRDPGLRDRPLGAFFELHIEQGPILDRTGCEIGIVTSVQGLRWLDVRIEGTDAHAGTTPLGERQDALLAAARIIDALHETGVAAGEDARVSVGRLVTATDGPSTIVGDAHLVIDIRHPDPATLDDLVRTCRATCLTVGARSGCAVAVSQRIAVEPTKFDEACVDLLEQASRDLGLRSRRMPSGALHDASNVAALAPTAMLFVPCRDGISHNVAEYATKEHLASGASVLTQALVARAGIVDGSV